MDADTYSEMLKANLEAARDELEGVAAAIELGLEDLKGHGTLAAVGGLICEPDRIARVERLLRVSLEIARNARF